MSAKNDMIK